MINKFLKFTTFGRYPQSKVTDIDVIKKLKELKLLNIYNKYDYIEYGGKEYKEYNDDYYLVEPIKWIILESNDNTYKLVSEVVLDECIFYYGWLDERDIDDETIYPNNYEYSNIRAWLNGYDGTSYNVNNYTGIGFIDIAFTEEERKLIIETLVDNSGSTSKSKYNRYACNNTFDKVYLLSYQDAENKYFTTDEERETEVTDYAKARGVATIYDDNGCFWLRSPDDDYSEYIFHENEYGEVLGFKRYNYNNSNKTYIVDYFGGVIPSETSNSYIGVCPVIEQLNNQNKSQ